MVLLWHYHDDDLPGPDAAVDVTCDNLRIADGRASVRQYRIDAEHSNAFTVWKKMGSPSAPNDAQYLQLVNAGQLAEFGKTENVKVNGGHASVKVNLPRQAVALLVFTWE
jgi:xylan 1,4-beta-xylosidase